MREVGCVRVKRRQVIDLPPQRVVVIEHQSEQKCCPACQQISVAAFPEDVRAPVQYGAACGAVAVYLVQQQLLPYERACEVMQDVLGLTMSVGTLQALVQRCAKSLEAVEQQIKTALSCAEVLHQDETGLYVAGQRHWMHVSSTPQLTHYAVHPKRGKKALEAIGILKDFQGVSVHDGWRSYWQYPCQHALCNVHHLRELTFLHEEQQQDWAGQMKTVLLDIKAAVDQARVEGHPSLPSLEVADWKAQYLAVLHQGYQANPPDPPPEVRKKGRRKQSAPRNLLDRLSKNQDAVLAFLDNFAVPFDNSQAERDIRIVKRHREVIQESQHSVLVLGQAIQQIAGCRLFPSSFLPHFWWRIRWIGLIALVQHGQILRFPVGHLQGRQTRVALDSRLIDSSFDVQQHGFHLARPVLLLLFMQKGQLPQMVNVAERMLTGILPIGTPAIMHTHSLEVLEDANGFQGLFAPLRMDGIVRQLRRRTDMHPVTLACHIQPRFILMQHLCTRERRFDLLLHCFQGLCTALHQGLERAHAHRESQHILHHFTRSLIGQQLLLHQVDGHCSTRRPILHGGTHVFRESRDADLLTSGAALLFALMFDDHHTLRRQINDLAALHPHTTHFTHILLTQRPQIQPRDHHSLPGPA